MNDITIRNEETEKSERVHDVFVDFGRALTELRNHYRLTQSEAAAKMGITEKKLAAIERGVLYSNLTWVCKRAEALGGRLAIIPAESDSDPHCQFIEIKK